MNCPYCGKEMKKGYLQSRDGLYWSEKKRAIAALPPKEASSIHLLNNFEDYRGVTSGDKVIAYNCADCKMVIVRYGIDDNE